MIFKLFCFLLFIFLFIKINGNNIISSLTITSFICLLLLFSFFLMTFINYISFFNYLLISLILLLFNFIFNNQIEINYNKKRSYIFAYDFKEIFMKIKNYFIKSV